MYQQALKNSEEFTILLFLFFLKKSCLEINETILTIDIWNDNNTN